MTGELTLTGESLAKTILGLVVSKEHWGPHDTRDKIVGEIKRWTVRVQLPAKRLLGGLELGRSKIHDWKGRFCAHIITCQRAMIFAERDR